MTPIDIEVIANAYKEILTLPIYHAFLFVVLFDILIGSAAALSRGEYKSNVGTNGVLKHIVVVIIVLAVCPYLSIMGMQHYGTTILMYYIVNYVISILEILSQSGIPFPHWVAIMFEDLQEKSNQIKHNNKE